MAVYLVAGAGEVIGYHLVDVFLATGSGVRITQNLSGVAATFCLTRQHLGKDWP